MYNAVKTGSLRLCARCSVLRYRTPSGPSPEVVAVGCRGTVVGCFAYSRYLYYPELSTINKCSKILVPLQYLYNIVLFRYFTAVPVRVQVLYLCISYLCMSVPVIQDRPANNAGSEEAN